LADAQRLVETLGLEVGATAAWQDCRNASMALVLPPQGLSVQVLLEFQRHGASTALVNSREGMGHGAGQTRHCFEQLLAQLEQQIPAVQMLYRSDRDGPIRLWVIRSLIKPNPWRRWRRCTGESLHPGSGNRGSSAC